MSDTAFQNIKEKVKLVIWDLDDTFWEGTLSEGPVTLDERTAAVVDELNARGIVSAICSKNDPEVAKAELTRLGVWDQFVFPAISWMPKGEQVKQLIDDMQLRPSNVLFLDDNPLNLAEASYYSPGLMTAGPEVVPKLLEHPQLKGQPDPERTRQGQYRELQAKKSAQRQFSASNEEFLRSCDIHVEIIDEPAQYLERLLDLINRSNQLNFTKTRYTADELSDVISDPDVKAGCVRVRDRFSDYGISGFFAVQDGVLSAFAFSCRLMNMGVEQWLWRFLREPELHVVGDVSSDPFAPTGDWITLASPGAPEKTEHLLDRRSSDSILLKGPCDLIWVGELIAGDGLVSEVTAVADDGEEVAGHHTEILLRATPSQLARHGATIDRIPFLSRASYTSELTTADADFAHVVYSLIIDYTNGLYRERSTGLVVPIEQENVDITDRANWDRLVMKWRSLNLATHDLEWFAENFEYLGPMTPDRLIRNVRQIASLRPASHFIFLNAPEVPSPSRLEPKRHELHALLNTALEDAMRGLPNAEILDVREIVRSTGDVTTDLRHYTRRAYHEIAEALSDRLGPAASLQSLPWNVGLRRTMGDAKRRLKRATQRV